MKVFGLTGGMGMGKSMAARFFREHGVPVVDTDELARQLVEPGRPALAEIQEVFGESVVAPGGQLRRDALAQIVFTDPAARQRLETILHPRIRESWLAQIEAWRGENHALAVVVIPLLFETKAEPYFDKTICIACSAANQRHRLLERGWTPDQIQRRMAAQSPVGQKMARADFVVWTDGLPEVHAQQIERILAQG
ncbi:MAG TPA: dephospho-CoA kinase [Verrucomicrobiae bacterium]|nr:dephospho-CoA kinase [Verrucomicrobiae bacterium]